ncbi:MAG: hypothetical protein HQK98_06625 [Nitrospirae bacterium]|nr:hypothetical protein [Nitrospirota bacterium]
MLRFITDQFSAPEDVVWQFLAFASLLLPIIAVFSYYLYLKLTTDNRVRMVKSYEDILSIIGENDNNVKISKRRRIAALLISIGICVVVFIAGYIFILKGEDMPIALIGLLPSLFGSAIAYFIITTYKPKVAVQFKDLKIYEGA